MASPDLTGTNDWPFDQPRDCAVITLRTIAKGEEPILHVTHDEDDHGWQFLSLRDADTDEACVVCFESIIDIDPGLILLADLPPGWHAWRESANDLWQREPTPIDWDDEEN